jgi:hypothetical protein
VEEKGGNTVVKSWGFAFEEKGANDEGSERYGAEGSGGVFFARAVVLE